MKRFLNTSLLLILILMILPACTKSTEAGGTVSTGSESNIFEVAAPGSYDSEGTAIVIRTSEINKTITFYDYELGKSYTLNYDGVTRFSDRYDTAMTLGQVKMGSIVDVKFLKSTKTLVTMQESANSFTMTDVSGFSINVPGKVFSYAGESYRITKDTVLFSESEKVSINDLNSEDKLTISGIGNDILSICLEKGHGYLSLTGEKPLVGGFIEIGSKQIEQISEKMLIMVPEGKYDVKISFKGTEAYKSVVIAPNEETVLDLSDIEIAEAKTGQVLFTVTPQEATVSIDGKEVDATRLLTFEYGMHQLVASCTGYETITRYFNVGEDRATLTVNLDAIEDSSSEEEENLTEGYYLYITTPLDVEVYIDNIYIGLAPVRVDKTAGTHTVTLRKTGFETRSFNIVIQNTAEDVKYNFDDLESTSSSSGSGSSETTTSTESSTSAETNTSTSTDSTSSTSTETSASVGTESGGGTESQTSSGASN